MLLLRLTHTCLLHRHDNAVDKLHALAQDGQVVASEDMEFIINVHVAKRLDQVYDGALRLKAQHFVLDGLVRFLERTESLIARSLENVADQLK